MLLPLCSGSPGQTERTQRADAGVASLAHRAHNVKFNQPAQINTSQRDQESQRTGFQEIRVPGSIIIMRGGSGTYEFIRKVLLVPLN